VNESLLEPSMAWALLRKGRIQLIDVRPRDVLAAPRLPGARRIPLDELPRELATLDRERASGAHLMDGPDGRRHRPGSPLSRS